MSVSYVRPEWQTFRAWLDDHYEWKEVHPRGTRERVVDLSLPVDDKTIRIYTTIERDGEGRNRGSDAIRTIVWDHRHDVPMGGRERTNRIRTDDDSIRYLRNMHSKIEWLYANWKIYDEPTDCPLCDGIVRGSEGDHGEFLFCTEDSCDFTRGIPDAQCPNCGEGMIETEGEYGEFLFCSNCDHTEDS